MEMETVNSIANDNCQIKLLRKSLVDILKKHIIESNSKNATKVDNIKLTYEKGIIGFYCTGAEDDSYGYQHVIVIILVYSLIDVFCKRVL